MKNSKAVLDDKNQEIKLLNGVIKNNGDETLRLKNENKKLKVPKLMRRKFIILRTRMRTKDKQ